MAAPRKDEHVIEPVRDFAAPPRCLGPPLKEGDPIPSPASRHAYERMVTAELTPEEHSTRQVDPNGPAVCGMVLHDPAHLPLGAGGPAPRVIEEAAPKLMTECPPMLPLGAGGSPPRVEVPVAQLDKREIN